MVKRFVWGKFFPELMTPDSRKLQAANLFLGRRLRAGEPQWGRENNSLERYVSGVNPVFTDYLKHKINSIKPENRGLRVLDVGIGSGEQWRSFVLENPVELHATTLNKKYVIPELKGVVKTTSVSNLHLHYPPDHFDVIVSNFGSVGQPMQLFEEAMHLLKPGGELLAAWYGNFNFPRKNTFRFKILDYMNREGYVFYRIKKVG